MDTAARTSGYQNDKTIGQVAREWVDGLQEEVDDVIARMDDGEDAELDCYGIESLTTVEVTIAGGGPGADVSFVFGPSGDFRTAFLRYYESNGTAEVTLSDKLADDLMAAWGIDISGHGAFGTSW